MKRIKLLIAFILIIFIFITTSRVYGSFNMYAYVAAVNGESDAIIALNNVSSRLNNMNYVTITSVAPTYEQFDGYISGTNVKRLNSSLLCLIGHANPYSLYVQYNTGKDVSISTYATAIGPSIGRKSVNDIRLNGTRLVVYAGCSTAAQLTTGLTDRTVANGASCSLGWNDSVSTNNMTQWLTYFFKYLDDGCTIEQANIMTCSKYYDDIRVKDLRYSGMVDFTIQRPGATRNIQLEEFFTPIKYNNKKIAFTNDELSLENINNFIKTKNNKFKEEDYIINISSFGNNNYSISYKLKIGNFITNSEYVVSIYKGNVVDVAEYNTNLNLNQTLKNNLIQNVEENNNTNNIKQLAINSINIDNITVVEQDYDYYYDVVQNKKYVRVYTTYKLNDLEDAINDKIYMHEI